jgi:hypothetical protein
MWALPEAMTGVVPSLVHLHHAKLTVWTPSPQHSLLRCVSSNITHRSEVTLGFQWEIGFKIFWLMMLQRRTETVFIPTPRRNCWMLWNEGIEWMVLHIDIVHFLMHLTVRPTLLENLDKQHEKTNSACISDKTPPSWSPFKWHELPIHMLTFVNQCHHRRTLVL